MGYLVYVIKNYLELQPSVQCDGLHNVTLPISVAEVWPNPIGEEKYDVTLFNGFNIPVTITPTIINPPKFFSLSEAANNFVF